MRLRVGVGVDVGGNVVVEVADRVDMDVDLGVCVRV